MGDCLQIVKKEWNGSMQNMHNNNDINLGSGSRPVLHPTRTGMVLRPSFFLAG